MWATYWPLINTKKTKKKYDMTDFCCYVASARGKSCSFFLRDIMNSWWKLKTGLEICAVRDIFVIKFWPYTEKKTSKVAAEIEPKLRSFGEQ